MYDVAELAGFPSSDGTHGIGWRVNHVGQVAGFVYTDPPNPLTQAFLWDPTSPASPITWIGDPNTRVGDLNNPGQVVGWWSADLTDQFRTAFLWNPSNLGMAALRLPGVDQQALGINDAGQVVGWYEATEQGSHTAFVWDPINGVQNLPSLGGNTSSEAHGINQRGLIVGRSGAPPGLDHVGRAVLWIPGPVGSFELVELNGPSDWVTVAEAIDQHGRIVGSGYSQAAGYDAAHALYWPTSTAAAPMTDLGSLGRQASTARDLNNNGEVVGYVSDGLDLNRRAFHWTGGHLTDLNDQISPGSGWLIEEANGINDAGVIVGVGVYNGQERAVLLTPHQATHHDTLADRLRGIVVAELTYILYGLVTGGGGAVIQPGGVPIPVPPPNPVWDTVPASTKDLLLGLVTNEVARLVQNPAARRELQRASLELVRQEVETQLRALGRE